MDLLISGAGGAIGCALMAEGKRRGLRVGALSHSALGPESRLQKAPEDSADTWLSNWTGRGQDAERLRQWLADEGLPTYAVHCGGVLHQGQQMPEKRLRDLDADFFRLNMERNCWHAVLLLQALEAAMTRTTAMEVALLSARVGSIGDNHLGGWYSYRMSKAALNMLIRTTAIEWQRRFPATRLLAIHPGTTDTPLSRPFQARIPPTRLASPATCAQRLLRILIDDHSAASGCFLNWNGQPLPW